MNQDFTPNLHTALQTITKLQASVRDPHNTATLLYRAPVIDRHHEWKQDDVQGLRKYGDMLDAQAAVLEEMVRSGKSPRDDPLPNVLALTTAWKQVLISKPPIAGVRVNVKGKAKEEGFVDVIARGGQEWIRMYSKKPSQLYAEFREQDSYINSDYSTSEDDDDELEAGPSRRPARPRLQNSLMTTAETLLSLSEQAERRPGAEVPRLTIRVTRVSEFGHEDERVQETFQAIRQKGIRLVFGDLSDVDLDDLPQKAKERVLRPSHKINLDPTALMGLCSDLLHHPLPRSMDEAKRRFYRPIEALQPAPNGRTSTGTSKSNGQANGEEEDGSEGQSLNSRELVKNTLEEMQCPLIEEIRDLLEARLGDGPQSVEFWATRESVRYFREALGSDNVVGEGMEQRRMRRLLGDERGDFFEGSRYEGKEGILKGIRLHVFDDTTRSDGSDHGKDLYDKNDGARSPMCDGGKTSFHHSLSALCSTFLSDYQTFLKTGETTSLPNFLKPNRLPVPKVASLSLPFPIVSLISLERGGREGMTTLMMGNIVLRDLWGQGRWKLKGWVQGDWELEDERESGEEGNAAVWMLPYRTLGEGKRVKFEKGDYSYPSK